MYQLRVYLDNIVDVQEVFQQLWRDARTNPQDHNFLVVCVQSLVQIHRLVWFLAHR